MTSSKTLVLTSEHVAIHQDPALDVAGVCALPFCPANPAQFGLVLPDDGQILAIP